MKSFFYKISLGIIAVFPLFAFAQNTLKSFVETVVDIIGTALIPLLFSAALALFIWGIFEFIQNADNPDKRQSGKKRMLWGIIALFAMVAYLGLTTVITSSFFSRDPILPQFFNNKK